MIHQYKNNGYNIVMDVNSGSVHIVDDVVYDVIPLAEQLVSGGIRDVDTVTAAVEACQKLTYSHDEVREAVEEILELAQDNVLFTEDIYEKYIGNFKQRQTVVKALCLHIAHDCNLACQYCFAEEGEYHGRRALMSFEVGKKALDFLVANSGSRVNLEVDFFGGEPLMNWQVVKDLVAYGRSLEEPHNKKFRFTLTTNGVLLNDEIMEFLNKEMSNVNYYVRGTFTHNNLDFSEDVKHLADLGFEQISVEPVVTDPKEPYALRPEDVPQLLEEYDKLAVELLKRQKEGRGVNFFHFMIDLSGGPCVAKRLSGCGSGTEYLAVTPWGDFYPCHQFVGNEKFLMGNVDEGIVRPDIVDEFKCCNVYAKEKCRSCFAKFYCSGGCAANSYNCHGKIDDVYELGCELQKKRVECAIMIKAALADEEE